MPAKTPKKQKIVLESKLLDGLNEEQKQAVTHGEGPLLIVAGAGTGKTTVITRRIAWLIEQKLADPEHILALTFTDKAAGEMEERVDLLLPYGYVDLQISTFHSFCEQLLRQYGVEIGLSQDFRLVNELDAWLLTRQNFEKFELDYYRPLGNPTKYLRGLLTHFSRVKDNAVLPEAYLTFAESMKADKDRLQGDEGAETDVERVWELARAYHTYQQVLLENDSLDFGDLLLYTLKLLRERPNVLQTLRKRFTYVLVDEFQDTNYTQYEIVKLLAAPRNNLTVVGDDDQAIYKFRGASLANILQYQTDYPDTKQVVLTHNYRSTQAILDHAYTFIQQNNPNRLEAQADGKLCKRLVSNTAENGVIEHIHCDTGEEEAETVAKRILELKNTYPDATWNDFAILTRSNDAAIAFVAALERYDVPYQFLALRGLYTKPAVLDLLALLHVIDNPFDSASFYRVLSLPMFKLPHVAVAELSHLANRKGKSLWEAAQMARSFSAIDDESQLIIDRILSLLTTFRTEAPKRSCSELFVTVARDSGYVDDVNHRPERQKKDDFRYLQQFYERMKRFEQRSADKALRHFMAEFKHERDAGEEGSLSIDLEAGPEMVRIMTVHASKGLEFRFVFVVNLVDRRFPSQARSEAIPVPEGLMNERLPEGNWHLEEERRLFYVAMTRAKQGLFLTSADGYGGSQTRKLSRFLAELGYEKPTGGEADETHPFLEEPKAEVVVEEGVVYQLPKQFSFTQLMAFRTCPLQYKFAHILKIPVFGKYQMSFGKTMHNTLQRFFTVWMERVGSVQTSLFDAPAAPSAGLPVHLDELLDMYADCWLDEWYADDVEREKYRAQGKQSLIAFYKLVEEERPNLLYLEQGFTLKTGGVVIKGRIDRIDACEDGVEIIDYKTGRPKEADKLERADKEQLYLYQLAVRDVLGLKPVKLTYHYLENNSRVSFLASEKDLIKLQEDIQERVANIRKSQFDPTPGFHCKNCDFADICEFRET